MFAAEPKYPSSEKSDNKEHESAADKEARSLWLINAQYSSIADFRNQLGGAATVPVMINGNLTASGHPGERAYVHSVLQDKLNNLYDYGLGNHDYDFNVAACPDCAAGSVEDLKNRYWGKVATMDLSARASVFTKTWYGNLAYSRDYGDVHLVQLHNEPTYSVNFSTQSLSRRHRRTGWRRCPTTGQLYCGCQLTCIMFCYIRYTIRGLLPTRPKVAPAG
ncbi:hypothetical protein [Pseudomonas sp. S34]|uniref:hypothetical protein n=1 Tax=Pseudomonas sp. S34 TaxID=1573718 RepID=UPI0015B380A3|nr:hypothetical protein [Pseudomonas sp. S34]